MIIDKLTTTTDPLIAKASIIVNIVGPHALDAALALALGSALLFAPQTQEAVSEEPYVSRIDAVLDTPSMPVQADNKLALY